VTSESAETAAIRSQERREVLTALAALPDRRREVLVLRYFLGLSESEIAATLGISKRLGEVGRRARSGCARRGPRGGTVMTSTEQRLADALSARARAVDSNSVRPLPTTESAPERRASRPRRWLAPAAAAISIALVTAVVALVSRHAPGAGQEPISPERAPFVGDLRGVDALSSTNAWAVGTIYIRPTLANFKSLKPVIMHWDGSRWQRVAAPTRPNGQLMSIAGHSPDDLWAVGTWSASARSPDVPLIMHWNGRTWRLARIAAGRRLGGVLFSVSARSADDAWAVGSAGAAGGLILHWDGRDWRQLPDPQSSRGEVLNSVTSISANDAWAVGGDHKGEVVLRWNGTRWRLVRTPSAGPGLASLTGVTALSPDEVWAAGTVADGAGLQVVRWDGATWQVVPDRGLPTFGQGFDSVAATSPDDVWAVGTVGHYTPEILIRHWNGLSWSRTAGSTRKIPGGLSALSVGSATDVWAVGVHEGNAVRHTWPLIVHWNGTSWTKVLS